MKLRITTSITLRDNATTKEIEQVRSEFEDVAWENNMKDTQPTVYIEKVEE